MKITEESRSSRAAKLVSLVKSFSAAKARNLSLLGVAGGLLLVGAVAANNVPSPETEKNAANNFTPDMSHDIPKEDQADAPEPELSSPAPSTGEPESSSSQSTELKVNGQSIDVPENGEVHRVITENNSHTTVDVTTQSSDGSSSTDIDVRSFSSTSSQ